MKARSEALLDKSIGSAVAAIEIYNKPNFDNRQECFVLLLQNAWELLLKAKVVKDNNNKITSIYVRDGRKYKTNAFKDKLTINFKDCLNRNQLSLHPNVFKNLEQLNRLRNAVAHCYKNSAIDQVVYEVGLAALINFRTCVNKWFDDNLGDHIHLVMPVAFVKNMVDLESEVTDKKTLANRVVKDYLLAKSEASIDENNHFFCGIEFRLLSVKDNRVNSDTPVVSLDNSASSSAKIILKKSGKLDEYPLSFTSLVTMLKKNNPGVTRKTIQELIKKHGIKEDKRYSEKSFLTQQQKDNYEKDPSSSTFTSIYNNNCYQHLDALIKKEKDN